MNSKTIAVILLSVLLLAGCGKKEVDQPVDATRRITTHTLQVGDYPEQFTVSGRVEHEEHAALSFRSGGIILEMNVDAGDPIAKGQRLAALNTTELEAMVTNASEVRLQAERDVQRLERLFEQDVITQKQLDDARTGLARARASEEQAIFVLGHAVIEAPFAGFVANRLAEEGEMIKEGHPVLRVVADQEQRKVTVGVPARLLPALQIGNEAVVLVEPVEQPLTGTIKRIAAVAEMGTGNFLVDIVLPAHKYLREGLIARVTINGPSRAAIAIPSISVIGGDDDIARVFVIQDEVATHRELRILGFRGDSLLVAPEVPEGSQIAAEGAGFLQNGDKVLLGVKPQ